MNAALREHRRVVEENRKTGALFQVNYNLPMRDLGDLFAIIDAQAAELQRERRITDALLNDWQREHGAGPLD